MDNFIEGKSQAQKQIVKELIEEGANVNTQDENGKTILMFASFRGYLEIVKELIKAGADVNIKDKNGTTALIVASYKEHKEIVKELIEAGANTTL